MSATSYTPGEWFGIVGSRCTVLLPPSEKERAGALWALVDEGAGFSDVLDALLGKGLSGLAAFVLIAESGATTQVVVRGDVTAAFETAAGSVNVSGTDAATWIERTLTSVDRVSVSVGDASGPAYVVESGLVRVSGIEVPPPAPAAAAPAPAPSLSLVPPVDPAASAPVEPAPSSYEDPLGLDDEPAGVAPIGDEQPVTEPVTEPVDELGDEHLDDDAPTDADLPPVPDQAAAPGFPPPPAFTPPAPSAPAASAPVVASPETEGSGLALPVARLDLSSGQQVDVDRVVVIGRAPDPNRFAPTDQPLLVTVPSPHQEISSTHLEVRPGTGADHGSAVVTDLGSTNGTVLQVPGRAPEELRPGVPVPLVAGAVIDLGDGLTITVQNP